MKHLRKLSPPKKYHSLWLLFLLSALGLNQSTEAVTMDPYEVTIKATVSYNDHDPDINDQLLGNGDVLDLLFGSLNLGDGFYLKLFIDPSFLNGPIYQWKVYNESWQQIGWEGSVGSEFTWNQIGGTGYCLTGPGYYDLFFDINPETGNGMIGIVGYGYYDGGNGQLGYYYPSLQGTVTRHVPDSVSTFSLLSATLIALASVRKRRLS